LGVFILIYDPRTQIVFYRNDDGVPLGPANGLVRQRQPKGDYDLQIRFNKYGFRDDQDLSDASTNDLFVVGDSVSFGWGVDISNRFSNLLADRSGLTVYNISVPTDIAG